MQLVLLGAGFDAEDTARRLLAGGHEIYLDNKDGQLLKRLGYCGKVSRMAMREALARLDEPRVVWSADLSSRQLDCLVELFPSGTILVNSRAQYFEDNVRLSARLEENRCRYIDVGAVSDEYRLALFVGGDPEAFQDVEPLLAALAEDGSYYHCGSAGAGHFLRCMHQKYEVQVQSALAGVITEIRKSPFNEGINLEAFLIFSHLFCKKQPLPDSVWQFLRTQAHSALIAPARNGQSAA